MGGLTARGRVTADGQGVAGARVVLSRRGGAWRATTDASGAFEVAGLPDQELDLDVYAPGLLPPAQRRARPGDGLAIALTRGASLKGRVLDPAGLPIAGAEVELSGEAGGRRLTLSAASRARRQVFAEGTGAAPARARLLPVGELGVLLGNLPAIPREPAAVVAAGPDAVVSAAEFTTGPEGAFHLTAIPRGRYTVHARHPDFAEGEAGPIDVPGGGPVTLRLARGAALTGRVTDPAGQPLFGADVVVREMKRTSGVTFTTRDGSYRLAHVTGRVTVRAGARGYRRVEREVVAEEGGQIEADFTLAPTGEAAPEGDGATGGLALDVRDGFTLGPLLTFTVVARGPGGASLTASGAQGDLDLGPLAPGAWRLTVQAPGYASAAFDAVVGAGAPAPLRLTLTQGATIAGTVYSRHGEPVAGAVVTCGLARGTTTPTGSFRLTGVPAGQVAVRADHPREGRAEIGVPLRNGDEALTLELRLE
jgi:hypothetical protein